MPVSSDPPTEHRRVTKTDLAVADLQLAAAKLDRFALDLPPDRRDDFADTAIETVRAAMALGRRKPNRSKREAV